MCEHGDTVSLSVPTFRHGIFPYKVKEIDRCIAPIIANLNAAGMHTVASCCGHGKNPGEILLYDGRVLRICNKTLSTLERMEGERDEAVNHVRALLEWLNRIGADVTGHPALEWLRGLDDPAAAQPDSVAAKAAHLDALDMQVVDCGGGYVVPMSREVRPVFAQVIGERDRLRKALALDTPFPADNVLLRLADAVDHLLSDHDCDAQGHEGLRLAEGAARQIAKALREREDGSGG